jgi:hypothetical protein
VLRETSASFLLILKYSNMIDQRYLAIYEEYQPNMNLLEFMLLIFVYEEQYDLLRIAHNDNFMGFTQSVRQLEASGLVKWHGDDPIEITLRKTGEDLFKKHVGRKKKITTAKEVTQWIQKWREIFPEGVNTGGFRYRGDRAECIKKMIKFVNTNDYTVEQIFQATTDYVDRFSQKGFAYMQQAHYFIEKKGVGSTLNSECESLTETKPKLEEGKHYGGSII